MRGEKQALEQKLAQAEKELEAARKATTTTTPAAGPSDSTNTGSQTELEQKAEKLAADLKALSEVRNAWLLFWSVLQEDH